MSLIKGKHTILLLYIAHRALSFGMKLYVVEIERSNETQMREVKGYLMLPARL